ncbi:hypothetical protein Tco_0252438 [Tanacetum coccineum]
MHIEKNVLEAILNTLLMNGKSKYTAKARQDLQRLGIRSGLWLGQTKNGKCLKPQAAYCFTPEDRKKFFQFIKGVKLPDGFESCFKHKLTDNDTNITGLKSHDCHIMMQRLLPYGLQNYLPDKIAKPIIELCSLFKQICSTTLMEDDMLKAQIKVVDILCDFELIYPPTLFDIMIHLVIHLPLEALEGGPIRPRWMFPFERYMKKLKGYVRNKAKLEGSIVKGYVAEEALTFSSHYFRDVTTKFNRPDRNVDPPPPTPEIDTYLSQFKSLFPNKDMKEEFPDWFGSQIRQHHVDNDKDLEVSTTSELFALACGPTWTSISINSCVVDGVRYVVHNRDERRTTKNSGICSLGPGGEMYYGQLQEILEFKYLLFKEDDHDIMHFDNSSDLPLSTSLNDLDNATLHIDGQPTEVDAPPDIINVMSVNVVRPHGGDGGGEDHPPPYHVATGCGGCFANRGKGKRKTNLGGRAAGRLHTRDKTRNLSLKDITDKKGPVPIRFEVRDKQTLMPLGDHAAHWSSYIGEVIRGVPLYYPSWLKVPKERKAALITDIGTQFDLRPHMESPDWTVIEAGIQQHLQKAYNTNKAAFKAQHWVIDTETGSYNVEKESVRHRQSSATQEYSSLIDTFFIAHTVDGVFTRDEDRLIYEEVRRLEATGTNTDDEINCLARGGKQRGHIPGVGRVLPARATASPSTPHQPTVAQGNQHKIGSGECGDDEESADDQEDEDGDGNGDGDRLPLDYALFKFASTLALNRTGFNAKSTHIQFHDVQEKGNRCA